MPVIGQLILPPLVTDPKTQQSTWFLSLLPLDCLDSPITRSGYRAKSDRRASGWWERAVLLGVCRTHCYRWNRGLRDRSTQKLDKFCQIALLRACTSPHSYVQPFLALTSQVWWFWSLVVKTKQTLGSSKHLAQHSINSTVVIIADFKVLVIW